MKKTKTTKNPLEYVHDILKGKCKTVILWHLKEKVGLTTYQLKKEVRGISEKMLLEQLNELRMYGLVDKKHGENPIDDIYFLTDDKGNELVKALEIMERIGKQYIDSYENK